ncbi:MAG: hypothetical protein CME70_06085 [Halobacteriovorax sp.]|nr:hypothetical protein [Halobacteriovorax sp.]|tara:strand:- start:1150 stop:1395 length:246 start_codon:yes stop_codon:yes gene_type:complete
MSNLLRNYIRSLLEIFESHHDEDEDNDKSDKLLVEPDDAKSSDKNELAVGGVPGAVTPLGTDSTYPKKKKKKTKKKLGKSK